MAKGDYATVRYSVGDGTGTETITAEQNGRTIEVDIPAKSGMWLSVTERTRGGSIVRESKYALTSVISITYKATVEE